MYKNFRTSQEFIDACNDLCMDGRIISLTYGGSQELNMYTIDYGDNEFILPEVNDRIIGVDWTKLPRMGVRLPEDMYMFGASYDHTFDSAKLFGNFSNSKLSFGKQYTHVTYIFHNADFYQFGGGLTIQDSMLNIDSMFHHSNGLQDVIFKNCELTGITNVFLDSDVRHVTFDNCSEMYVRGDYKGLASMIFASHTKKLTLKNCEVDFVNTIIGMFDGVDGFDNLEIEILD